METVVRNGHYEEALQLHNYVAKLAKKQPDVRILTDIQTQVAASMRLMLSQLVGQLRAPVQLPQCLKVMIVIMIMMMKMIIIMIMMIMIMMMMLPQGHLLPPPHGRVH